MWGDLVTFSHIKKIQNSEAWRLNALGLLHMFLRDKSNIEQAEKYFLKSYDLGVNGAAYNLAELYFLKNDFLNSFFYVKLVGKFGYKFPSKEYIDWARLYGQLLYLHGKNLDDKIKAIELLETIQNVDKSGISFYIIGFHEVDNENIQVGMRKIEQAVELQLLDAILFLGDMYMSGNKIDKNESKAKKYYLQAIKIGSGKAHYNLALIYKSEGDAKNMRKHLIMSAELGHLKAIEFWNRITSK